MSSILPYKQQSLDVYGRFVFVESCTNPVLIRMHPSGDEITLGYGQQYDIGEHDPNKRFHRLDIYNSHDSVNDVEIKTGDQRFTSGAASVGSAVTIVGASINLPVTLKNKIDINSIPAITIAANQSVNVGNFPSVWKVASDSALTVAFETAPTVKVSEFPLTQSKGKNTTPLADITLEAGKLTHTIAANSKRTQVILQAPETNTADLVVAGFFRLKPGGVVGFSGVNAITVTGIAGDKCHAGEEAWS